jgi:hypothetical protein
MLSPIRWSDQEPQVIKVLILLMTFWYVKAFF